MFGVLAWFAASRAAEKRARHARARIDDAVQDPIPETFGRRDFDVYGSGISLWTRSDPGVFRWPAADDDGDVAAVSLGIPVGARLWDGDGVAEIRRLLARASAGGLTQLLNSDGVAAALNSVEREEPDLKAEKTLQTFVALAVANENFAPLPLPSRPWRSVVRQRVRRAVVPTVRRARRSFYGSRAVHRP